eukprot:TRINITY_DN29087_c0_g1_i1.p1 TRINITY_DN29087_c0_g1~~TRINITY_DN29087_c0_g1_i1.p1  ORF type:complete len:1032 (-),score=180.13 TRINITY_DN29087_c0_g1_i1:80-2752(-)
MPEGFAWPSPASWSFTRCVAHLGVPALLDICAQGVSTVLVECHLDPDDSLVASRFGTCPPGALAELGPDAMKAMDTEDITQVRDCLKTTAALGTRAAEAVGAALSEAEDTPLRGVGAALLTRVLVRANDAVLQCPELLALAEAVARTEDEQDIDTEAIESFDEALKAVADSRFCGCAVVARSVISRLAIFVSRGASTSVGAAAGEGDGCSLDAALSALEATTAPFREVPETATALAAWLGSVAGRSATWIARKRVVALLARVAPFKDPVAAEALAARLRSDGEHWALHEAAIGALSEISAQGSPAIIAALASRLDDVDETTRLAILEVLERVAVPGDPAAIDVAAGCLADEKDAVRQRALDVLGTLASRGSQAAVKAVHKILSDGRLPVRISIATALGFSAPRGDALAVADLVILLGDRDPCVRDTALVSLERVAGRGHPRAIDAVGKLFQHGSWSVRAKAALVLGSIAAVGDTRAATLLAGRLEDTALGVRTNVPAALLRLAGGQPGKANFLPALMMRLKNPKWTVRQVALDALAAVARRDDPGVVALVAASLADEVSGVRHRAIVALQVLAVPPRSTHTSAVVKAALESRDPAVRCAGLETLEKIASRGDVVALKACRQSLTDVSPAVRERAVACFGHLALLEEKEDEEVSGTKASFKVAAVLVEDTAEAVRRAAAGALIVMAKASGDYVLAMAAIRHICDNQGQATRRLATAAFAQLQQLEATAIAAQPPVPVQPKRKLPGLKVKKEIKEAEDENGSSDDEKTVKREASPSPAPATFTAEEVDRGIQSFLRELQRVDAPHCLREGDTTADAVSRGLHSFMAEAKRRPGPICSLDVPMDASVSPSAEKRVKVELLPPPGKRIKLEMDRELQNYFRRTRPFEVLMVKTE